MYLVNLFIPCSHSNTILNMIFKWFSEFLFFIFQPEHNAFFPRQELAFFFFFYGSNLLIGTSRYE